MQLLTIAVFFIYTLFLYLFLFILDAGHCVPYIGVSVVDYNYRPNRVI